MRIVGIVLAAIVAGGVVGWLGASWKYPETKVDFGPSSWDFAGTDAPVQPGGELRAEVRLIDGDTFDFGTMAFDESQSHTFRVSNVGTQPLSLEIIDTTCKCTVGELQADQIPPGEARDVKLTWKASGFDPQFRQSATLKTNDPDTPTLVLTVKGRVTLVVQAEPVQLLLSQISRSEPGAYDVELFGFRDAALEVKEVKFGQPETAQYFSSEVLPMSAERLKSRKDALSGAVVRVHMKPGIPLGPLRQTVQITTNQANVGEIAIPLEANIISDVTIVAGRFLDRDLNLIHLGRIPSSVGKEVSVKLLAKGPRRRDLSIQLKSADPEEVLKVEIGAPTEVNSGAVIAYPVTIRVPPGSPSVDRFGRDLNHVGKLVFTTNHPEIPELVMYVSLVVFQDRTN